ncbi:MAG: type II toxin-antitoxin system death-on-curing family toxin [Micropruina sp.]|uniref:type II toxin-antitoxin system death-on-curing family toxin n=1 Tax=Micropruina sp. TaxID=2737536 RepID=UPI0039E4D158
MELDDILTLIDDLGVGPIRDVGLLDSAAHRPQATVFGTDAYPTLDRKAAVLLESLVRNHALIDGNKRLGWLATVVFYGLNDITIEAPDDDAYDLVIGIASGVVGYQEAALQLAPWTDRVTTLVSTESPFSPSNGGLNGLVPV